MTAALIVPVPAALAIEWAYGHYTDSELLHLVNPFQPGRDIGIFILSLFGRAAWRELRRQIRQYPNARCVVTRTKHPTVAAWLTHYGAEPTKEDLPGEWRYLAPRTALERFLNPSAALTARRASFPARSVP